MCLICKNLRRRSWSLDDLVETLLEQWENMGKTHREEVWIRLYNTCVEDRRYDLVRTLLE